MLALPNAALVGGTFRLLAIRLHGGKTDPEELQPGLLGWIDAYLTPAARGGFAWHGFPLIEPPANLALSSMRSPPAVTSGGRRHDAGELARNQRERILHATMQAVYQYTYPATTVQDIVAYAGVSRRVFHRHFRDREHATKAANSPAAIQQAYDRLGAFSLFLEEGYSYREQTRQLPRLCSEAIAAVMFEFGYRAARRHPAAAELPKMLPVFAYVCLAPFLGPDQASDFVWTMAKDGKLRHGERPDTELRP